jgi:hypothetical protein
MVEEISKAAPNGDVSRPASSGARRASGYVGLGLAVLAAVAIVAGLPWQVRFPLVVIAVLFGPGIPLMLALTPLPAVKSVVAGVGLDVSLVLLAGEAMVLAHIWQPDVMVGVLLVASAIASAGVLVRYRGPRYGAGHA